MTSFNDGIEAAAKRLEEVCLILLAKDIRALKRPEPIEEERVERMGAGTMTYPEDVLKAAREAAAKYWDTLDAADSGEGYDENARLCRSGECDADPEVQSTCIAIMAEREHWADFAKEQVKRASEDGYRIGQLEGKLKSAQEKFLNRAESLIAKGKDLPFKPSFGMLVIEWLREVAKEGK